MPVASMKPNSPSVAHTIPTSHYQWKMLSPRNVPEKISVFRIASRPSINKLNVTVKGDRV